MHRNVIYLSRTSAEAQNYDHVSAEKESSASEPSEPSAPPLLALADSLN